MSLSEGIFAETGRFVAHPWYCDANGHLNTRYYQGFFDDATQHLLALCGQERQSSAGGISIVDVRCAMEYKAEVAPGALLVVSSGFKALGGKSLTSIHEMRSVESRTLYATCETVSVFFDLDSRESTPMTEAFRVKASKLLVQPTAWVPQIAVERNLVGSL